MTAIISIQDLPLEIWEKIFFDIGPPEGEVPVPGAKNRKYADELCKVAFVCKDFKNLAGDVLKKRYDIGDSIAKLKELKKLKKAEKRREDLN